MGALRKPVDDPAAYREWLGRVARRCSSVVPPLGSSGWRIWGWGVVALLKPHQREGLAWLMDRLRAGVNPMVADEGGTGKTLLGVAMMAHMLSETQDDVVQVDDRDDSGANNSALTDREHPVKQQRGPFLVVCPVSVVDVWEGELMRWAPHVRRLKYVGDRLHRYRLREALVKHIRSQPTSQQKDPVLPFDVLMTSYELAMHDAVFLSRFRWRCAIIDEAHRLHKNPSGRLYTTLMLDYMIPRRVLITATPTTQHNINNGSLSDLFALLHFMNPNIFYDEEMFVEAFEQHADELKECLGAFVLRRSKDELVRGGQLILPPLAEVTLYAPLVPMQAEVYRSILLRQLPSIMRNGGKATTSQNTLMQLRKACSHPYMFPGFEPEPFELGEHLVRVSGKLLVLDSLLTLLFNSNNNNNPTEGHKVLLFAQMTRTLDILQDYLHLRGWPYERLDGSVRAEECHMLDDNNNNNDNHNHKKPDQPAPMVYLLSTRASVAGINLTAADTVVFYESDWNPHADINALQRAHRLGQSKAVLALRIIAAHTLEEVILARAQRKLALADIGSNILGPAIASNNADAVSELSTEEMQHMVQYAAHKHLKGYKPQVEDAAAMFESVKGALAMRGKASFITTILAAPYAQPREEQLQPQQLQQQQRPTHVGGVQYSEGKDYAIDRAAIEEYVSTQRGGMRDVVSTLVTRRGAQLHDYHLHSPPPKKRKMTDVERESDQRARLASKWQALGYSSCALPLTNEEGEEEEQRGGEEEEVDINYVVGDATKPFVDSTDGPAFVVSVVDNSGAWGRGGMFAAWDRAFAGLQAAYESAHTAGDLHVGDLHLVPTPIDGKVEVYAALAVAQRYDRRHAGNPRSDVLTDALKAALRRLAAAAIKKKATVHMLRIGDWYATERIVRKCLTRHGIPVTVYYHKQKQQR
eukprot:jgi/Chlat1/1265/Chrsp115S01665